MILSGRGVTAMLGPTNTGKTHFAIERMVAHSSGIIGLPLRLLAREVYTRLVERVGVNRVALITGEEKIRPANPRWYVCTVEAMPRDLATDFLAVDEIQLCADPERGHVFTDRILHARGRHETLLLGATTMAAILKNLLDAQIESRPRFSELRWKGAQKLSRLPRRSAITAFSADNVYAIAEVIRQQRGGAAVVMGGYSQVLFGLKGERWAEEDAKKMNTLFSNPAWMFPLMDDTPERLRGGGAGSQYWARRPGDAHQSCPV